MNLELNGFAPLLTVFDMPASVAFYRDILGFEVVETSKDRDGDDFGWGLLRRDGIEIMLNTAYDKSRRPPAQDPSRFAVHKDAALFFGCRDLDGAYAYFRSRAIDAEPPFTQSYGMRQLYVLDPDGYNICLQWPVS